MQFNPLDEGHERRFTVSKSVWERIEESRERHNVLEHPFYVRWSEGDLTGEELADYAGQYRHATAAIARLCADAAAEAPGETRDELRRHAAEEEDHIGLWDGFVEATGGTIGAEPHAETAECVDQWTGTGDYLETLARLYAIESGQPEIAKIKRDGLVSLYGFNEGPATDYFRVHETDDIAHTEESRRLITAAMKPEDEDRVVAAAESAFQANLRLLDGVQS
jgi:pyrroloquinoline-quinone synthase